ncbi:hypothetical protein RDI58_027081 [Solanum bulbocastanum]|uniref:Uncharacterized protein n=1 Tax=Solanum bulbocastanum TaxID=147425 RepID=A0AAN8Y1H1_SOLBU
MPNIINTDIDFSMYLVRAEIVSHRTIVASYGDRLDNLTTQSEVPLLKMSVVVPQTKMRGPGTIELLVDGESDQIGDGDEDESSIETYEDEFVRVDENVNGEALAELIYYLEVYSSCYI